MCVLHLSPLPLTLALCVRLYLTDDNAFPVAAGTTVPRRIALCIMMPLQGALLVLDLVVNGLDDDIIGARQTLDALAPIHHGLIPLAWWMLPGPIAVFEILYVVSTAGSPAHGHVVLRNLASDADSACKLGAESSTKLARVCVSRGFFFRRV